TPLTTADQSFHSFSPRPNCPPSSIFLSWPQITTSLNSPRILKSCSSTNSSVSGSTADVLAGDNRRIWPIMIINTTCDPPRSNQTYQFLHLSRQLFPQLAGDPGSGIPEYLPRLPTDEGSRDPELLSRGHRGLFCKEEGLRLL